jgi:hypothetical protein
LLVDLEMPAEYDKGMRLVQYFLLPNAIAIMWLWLRRSVHRSVILIIMVQTFPLFTSFAGAFNPFDTNRVSNINPVACICKQAALMIHFKDDDAVAVLIGY